MLGLGICDLPLPPALREHLINLPGHPLLMIRREPADLTLILASKRLVRVPQVLRHLALLVILPIPARRNRLGLEIRGEILALLRVLGVGEMGLGLVGVGLPILFEDILSFAVRLGFGLGSGLRGWCLLARIRLRR